MQTVLEIIKKTTDFFASRGIENPRLNAELLIGHGLGLKRMQLYLQFERPLTESDLERIRPLVRRRAQREPLQYVVGETDFHGLVLKTDRRALIPRPETELLVELVIERLPIAPRRIADLGTGSGAIALALAVAFPAAEVVGVDLSKDALQLAGENATKHNLATRVSFVESNWFAALRADASFDVIVANPPYLTEEETALTSAEVRDHEPHSALTASSSLGESDLSEIVSSAPAYLAPGGLLALETGINQHAVLTEQLRVAGYVSIESRQDLTNRDRFLFARRADETKKP